MGSEAPKTEGFTELTQLTAESIDPRIDITFTLAATKAADVGFVIELHGAPDQEQIDAAIGSAETAIVRALGLRQKAMYIRDNPPPADPSWAISLPEGYVPGQDGPVKVTTPGK